MESPKGSTWQAPLVPVALALTGGIILDRYAEVPIGFSLAVILAGLIAWAVTSPLSVVRSQLHNRSIPHLTTDNGPRTGHLISSV